MDEFAARRASVEESLRRLIDKQLDETITVDEREELESRIRHDEQACDQYLIYTDMHAHLYWLAKGSPTDAADEPESEDWDAIFHDFALAPAPPAPFWSRSTFKWTVAASAAAICAFVLLAMSQLPAQRIAPIAARSAESTPPHVYREALWSRPDVNLAMIEESDAARWRSGQEWAEGDLLQAGDHCELAEGTALVKFADGARVVLEGPATFVVRSSGAGYLQSGRLAARVPPPAVGFTIDTPSSRIIDRGTAFGVEVDDQGDVALAVFEGAVDLASDREPDRRLISGEAGRVRQGKFQAAPLSPRQFQVVRQALPASDPGTDIDLVLDDVHVGWDHATCWSDQQPPHAGANYHVGRTEPLRLRTPGSRADHLFAGDVLTIHPRGELILKHSSIPKTFTNLRLAGGRVSLFPLRSSKPMWINAALQVTAPSHIDFREPHTNCRAALNGSLAGHAPLTVRGAGELQLHNDGGGFTGDWQVEGAQLGVYRPDALGAGDVHIAQGGALLVRCDVVRPKMQLTLDQDARLVLHANLTVGGITFNDQTLPPGEYSPARLRMLSPHQFEGEDGMLIVTGLGGSP